MTMNFWITLIIVTLTYIGIAIGRWPILRANRTTIALIGVGLLIAARQIAFDQIGQFLNLDTLALLFAMMIINANLQLAGFFQLSGSFVLNLARSPRTLLAIEIILSGVLSALFLNDTICLIFTPLIISITQAIRRNPIPYLIALATSSNIGSTATLTGNPQNMIVGVTSHISYFDFLAALFPVALIGLIGVWVTLVLLYPAEFRRGKFPAASFASETEINRPLLIKSLAVVTGMLIAFLLGVPIPEAAFLAACVLLISRKIKPESVFFEFNWGLLAFFAALFIVTGSLEANGVAAKMFQLAHLGENTDVVSLSIITAVLSNLVSNVPAVLLLKGVIPSLSNPFAGWLTLAAASTLAGNLTLLGSVANLIVAEIAAGFRIQLDFWEYTKAGIIITLFSLAAGVAWLQFFVWR